MIASLTSVGSYTKQPFSASILFFFIMRGSVENNLCKVLGRYNHFQGLFKKLLMFDLPPFPYLKGNNLIDYLT